MKKNLFLLMVIFAVLSAAVLSASADSVKVAINPDTKPFKYLDENGNFAGIDAEVINAIAEETGLELEFVQMGFDEILDAVASCEVDAAISAFTKNENRQEMVLFTEPYLIGSQSTFVRIKNDSFKDITDSNIKTIGSKTGTTGETSARIIAETFNYEKKHYENYADLFAALENDEIDAAISDEFLAKEFVDAYADIMTIGQPLANEPYAIAVCPDKSDLLQTLNTGLAAIQKTGKVDQIVLQNLMAAK